MIRKLSPEIVTHIAAGQVVERASSVVKELIENALDAGATRIQIELDNAGYDRIMVIDNGKGMSQKDLQMSFLPHTTSKISSLDDLLNIQTFGFRGEALASIAAVSLLTLESKPTAGVKGWKVEVEHGALTQLSPIGMPDGTRITVERLFADIPARKKFLKSVATEVRAITDVVTRSALAQPRVAFEVKHNGTDILRTGSHSTALDRLAQLVDTRFAATALPVEYSDGHTYISGYISAPAVSRSSDATQYVSINGRPIHNLDLRRTIKKAYGSLLEPRAYPICVLDISYPFESVDVNVDPRKQMVRFLQQIDIYENLDRAIKQSLEQQTAGYSISTTHPTRDMDLELGEYLKTKVRPWSVKNIAESEISQLLHVYLVVESDDGMLLIDQHAAHERILYEQFLHAYEAEKKAAVPFVLSKPYLIEVSPTHAQLIEEYAQELERLGFQIESFGQNQYKIEGVPMHLKSRSLDELIPDMLDELAHGTAAPADNKTHRTLTYLACRSAVMAGDALTHKERKRLVSKLFTCQNPYTCPHGRPTCIQLSRQELDTMFKRR